MKAKTEKDLKLPRYFASVIVMNKKGKVLLGKRSEDGIITPPGGHAEDHETPTQAAVRELFEETAIAAKEKDLVELPTIDTVHGKVCHCYLLEVKHEDPIPDLDPDKEVKGWGWYSEDELPKGIEKDPRRFESVRNAFMKFHGIMKGGPGSGQVGHKTFHPEQPKSNIISLVDKLSNPEPFKAHLSKLQHGATFEGAKLRSGKPVYLNADQAMAHGYTPEDYTDASNFHYGKMEEMSKQIQKIKALGKQPPHEMAAIQKFHEKQFKTNHKMAETVSRRAKDVKEKMHNHVVKKSVVHMGQQDAAEIDTAKFAVEHNAPRSQDLIQMVHRLMDGYNYGDVPREIAIDKGMLMLTKVDDGMYSGYVRLAREVDDGVMQDNAKIRIERMTVPSLVDFLLAKEYVLPGPSIAGNSPGNNNAISDSGGMAMAQPAQPARLEPLSESASPEQYQQLNEVLTQPKVEPNSIDKKIKILELLEKLTSH